MNGELLVYSAAAPFIAGLACLALPDNVKLLTKTLALAATLFSLAASAAIFVAKPLSWAVGPGDVLLADNLSAFIGMAISLFAFLTTVYSFSFTKDSFGRYFGYVLMTLGGSLGAVFASNYIVLMVCWGFLALTLYLLINMNGTEGANATAKKTLIVVGGTDSILILGVALVWLVTGSFEMGKVRLEMNGAVPLAAYVAIAIAAFAKAGAIPFHSWVPDAAENAPTPVTAYLPASLDKLLGIYLLARASTELFVMNGVARLILLVCGSVTIVLAVIMALVQHDMKRLLGYHAVSQVGYMVLGIGTGVPVGIAGGVFHMLNNAVYKTCLFLSGGNVEKATGTTDLASLGGLARYMPVTFLSFLVASLSISGIPPFNGFVSKWMIYQGIIESAGAKDPLWPVWLSAAMFGSALTLASFMKLLHTVFLGRPSKDFGYVKEAPPAMLFPAVTLASICVVFGVFAFKLPIPLLINPAIGTGVTYIGAWHPVTATILLVLGLTAGLLVYLATSRGPRKVKPFVGGEDGGTMERLSGTDFYNTLKEIGTLKFLYRRQGALDVYEDGSKVTFFFARILQWLHNGILPTYMVWCLAGMLILFFIFMR